MKAGDASRYTTSDCDSLVQWLKYNIELQNFRANFPRWAWAGVPSLPELFYSGKTSEDGTVRSDWF